MHSADENLLAEKQPQTFFDLIEKVGSQGKYQLTIMLAFSMMWFTNGALLLSSAFLFLNPDFDCESSGLLVEDCYTYVCSLPEEEWSKYVDAESLKFKSLANQFSAYYCSDEIYLTFAQSCTYLGSLTGYLIVSFFSDNWGRKKSIILAWTFSCSGMIILILSQHLAMAACGLFMIAFGCDSGGNITIYILSEVSSDQKRQQYCIIMGSFFVMGAIITTILFYFLEDWQLVCIFGFLSHMLIVYAFLILYVQETPMFLLKKDLRFALKSLNRIGSINKKMKNILTEDDLQNVKRHQQTDEKAKDGLLTYVDLCKFASLRTPTICMCIITFSTYIVYYGPSLIVDQIGFDIYTTNIIVSVADLLTYLPCYILIPTIQRKKAGVLLFAISTLMAGLLMFVSKPEDCDYCSESIIEIIALFIFRFSITMEFSILIVYMSELFPGRARGLGCGIANFSGSAGSTICPVLLGVFDQANLNPMMLFTLVGLIGIATYTVLPETQGKIIPEEIEEVQVYCQSKISKSNFSENRPDLLTHDEIKSKQYSKLE